MADIRFLDRRDGPKLAYARTPAVGDHPERPMVVFLGGFRSDMNGTKAKFLEERCRSRGQAYLRFDYSGHGLSAGRFEHLGIEQWRDDALAVLDRLTAGPLILVGSSMGGWIALLLTLLRPERVKGLVGIAAAPDFTRTMPDGFDDVMRESFASRGFAEVPSDYGPEPYRITRILIESGNRVCLLDRVHDEAIPMRLLQGLQDTVVPGTMPESIAAAFPKADIQIHLVPDGDHSLSRPQDLALLDTQVEELSGYR